MALVVRITLYNIIRDSSQVQSQEITNRWDRKVFSASNRLWLCNYSLGSHVESVSLSQQVAMWLQFSVEVM